TSPSPRARPCPSPPPASPRWGAPRTPCSCAPCWRRSAPPPASSSSSTPAAATSRGTSSRSPPPCTRATPIPTPSRAASAPCPPRGGAGRRPPPPPPDGVFRDPPREGADRVNMDAVLRARRRIVYVSCDPQTLARDARRIAAAGLKLVRAVALDLMPQTYH